MDALFFRWTATATLCVSPECARQVQTISKGKSGPILEFKSQFKREYFLNIAPPPPHAQRPFRILYAGRIVRNKGVFDILEMTKKLDVLLPGQVQWDLCGLGPDLDELTRQRDHMGLAHAVTIHGWTSPTQMLAILAMSHLAIVPTTSDFPEAMAKTAIEAVLAGRPVLTCPVVPALEVLRPACLEARPDDVESYVRQIQHVLSDEELYSRLCAACFTLQDQFYDRQNGIAIALESAAAIAES
jgi:glycosyltransferase involved in cell wall biosynthesis